MRKLILSKACILSYNIYLIGFSYSRFLPGNTAIALAKVKESYESLKESFKTTITEVNQLHEEKSLLAFDQSFNTTVLVGGDYKV